MHNNKVIHTIPSPRIQTPGEIHKQELPDSMLIHSGAVELSIVTAARWSEMGSFYDELKLHPHLLQSQMFVGLQNGEFYRSPGFVYSLVMHGTTDGPHHVYQHKDGLSNSKELIETVGRKLYDNTGGDLSMVISCDSTQLGGSTLERPKMKVRSFGDIPHLRGATNSMQFDPDDPIVYVEADTYMLPSYHEDARRKLKGKNFGIVDRDVIENMGFSIHIPREGIK